MQTGSSETLIGWKSGKTTRMSLFWTEWRELVYGLRCREVKTEFCRKRSMQIGSSETLIGGKSGKTIYVPLWERREEAWLWIQIQGGKIWILPKEINANRFF
jgi:hypothetical protein